MQVANITTGARFETYVITGPLTPAPYASTAPRPVSPNPGDELIVLAFGWFDDSKVAFHAPRV